MIRVSKQVTPGDIPMHTATTTLAALLKNEDGLAAMEYGLVAALVAIVAIAGIQLLGNNLLAKFNQIAAALG